MLTMMGIVVVAFIVGVDVVVIVIVVIVWRHCVVVLWWDAMMHCWRILVTNVQKVFSLMNRQCIKAAKVKL